MFWEKGQSTAVSAVNNSDFWEFRVNYIRLHAIVLGDFSENHRHDAFFHMRGNKDRSNAYNLVSVIHVHQPPP